MADRKKASRSGTIPRACLRLGARLTSTRRTAAGNCVYGRKHVPWISFASIPNGTTVEISSNLPGCRLWLWSFRISITTCITASRRKASRRATPGFEQPRRLLSMDADLQQPAQRSFDEDDDKDVTAADLAPSQRIRPASARSPQSDRHHLSRCAHQVDYLCRRVRASPTSTSSYAPSKRCMGCQSRETQQPNPAGAGIADETIVTGVFEPLPQPAGTADHHSLPAAPSSDVNMTLPLWLMG